MTVRRAATAAAETKAGSQDRVNRTASIVLTNSTDSATDWSPRSAIARPGRNIQDSDGSSASRCKPSRRCRSNRVTGPCDLTCQSRNAKPSSSAIGGSHQRPEPADEPGPPDEPPSAAGDGGVAVSVVG